MRDIQTKIEQNWAPDTEHFVDPNHPIPKTVKKWMISYHLRLRNPERKKPLLCIHGKYYMNDRCISSVSLSLLALFCHSIIRSRIPVACGRRYCADVYAIEVQ